MITIPLTRGLVTVIDDEDYDSVAQHKWCVKRDKNTCYAIARFGARIVRMHRLLTGAKPGQDVDHIDRDGLNNQRANLRLCGRSENLQNMRKRKGSSQFKGVRYFKRDANWSAQIKYDGRIRHLGYHQNEIDAARAYDAAAREHFGEFSALNFPLPGERSALLKGGE